MNRTGLLCLFLLFAAAGCDDPAFRSAFPPEGYFDPLLEIELRPGVSEYRGEIVHDHEGDYSVSIALARANAVGAGYEFQRLDVQCEFSMAAESTRLNCGQSLAPYRGEESGISIGLYRVPRTVETGEAVMFTLRFHDLKELESLIATHGSATLVVHKWSDL